MSRAVTPGDALSGLRSLGFPVRLRAGAQRIYLILHANPVLCRNRIDEKDPEVAGLADFGRLDGAGSGAESGTRS
jgi:hypothetical protein